MNVTTRVNQEIVEFTVNLLSNRHIKCLVHSLGGRLFDGGDYRRPTTIRIYIVFSFYSDPYYSVTSTREVNSYSYVLLKVD